MKRLWFPVLLISAVLSAASVFYVAVGAAAEEGTAEAVIPEGVFERNEREKDIALRAAEEKLRDEPCGVYALGDEGLTLRLLGREYEGEGLYEMDYTVNGAYLSESLPEGVEMEKLRESEGFLKGDLQEGYIFVLVDVIIESEDMVKQMYQVNAASLEGGALVGFSGQQFSNTALLHAELYPDDPFETTLVFVIEKERAGNALQLYINNFGFGSPNATCAYIDMEIEK